MPANNWREGTKGFVKTTKGVKPPQPQTEIPPLKETLSNPNISKEKQTETNETIQRNVGTTRRLLTRHPEARGIFAREFSQLDGMLQKVDSATEVGTPTLVLERATKAYQYAVETFDGTNNPETLKAIQTMKEIIRQAATLTK